MAEYGSGDDVTVSNRMGYPLGLKLDGQRVSTGVVDFPIPDLEIGPTDHPLPGFQFIVTDFTNGRNVPFTINLTVSNAGYRTIAGRTFEIINPWGQKQIITYEHFPDGQQSGTLHIVNPDDSIQIGTWSPYSFDAFQTFPCEAGDRDIEYLLGTRNTSGGWADVNTFIYTSPGHVLFQMPQWHFCPELQQNRRVLNDH
jgi:hypothetical protein